MDSKKWLMFFMAISLWVNAGLCDKDDEDDDNDEADQMEYINKQVESGNMQRMSFSTPDLTEEEEHSTHMPTKMRCDGCCAVAHVLTENLEKKRQKYKSKKYIIPESELIDLLEEVCGNKETFDNYGVKDLDGVKRLSGPGLEASDSPGVMSGGGKWPGRLVEICGTFIGELGEEEIYEVYRNDPKPKTLEKFLCYGTGLQGYCRQGKDEL